MSDAFLDMLAAPTKPPTQGYMGKPPTKPTRMPQLPVRNPAPMPLKNRFAGACHICGKPIAAGDGTLVKLSGAWKVQCRDATQCAFANSEPTDVPVEVTPTPLAKAIAARLPEPPKPNSKRPDFADDIDRIVRELVTAGDVVWDNEAQAYRKPHCRTFKWESVS